MKMRNTFFILVFILSTKIITSIRTPIVIDPIPYIGIINQNSTGDEYKFDLTSIPIPPNSVLNIKFQILNASVQSLTFVMTSYKDEYKAGNISKSYFYGMSNRDFYGIMDLNSMQLYKTQYINIDKNSTANNLYLTVYNLDAFTRRQSIQYRITLDVQISLGCPSCNSGFRDSSYNAQCSCTNCQLGFYGIDCSIQMNYLSSSAALSVPIAGPSMAYFLIKENQAVTINIKLSSGSGQVYFQFVSFSGQFASYTNVAVGTNTQGRFLLYNGTNTPISASSDGSLMSITVAVYQNINTTVDVIYYVPQTSSVLVIVLGVLGGVLFVGLIIAACYIVRNTKFFSGDMERDREPGRSSVRNRIQPNLTDQEIERFFPTVMLKTIYQPSSEDVTISNLNHMKKQPIQDCVICLQPMTYCNHIFHSLCLVGWFKKHQNCPYCREQFNKINTIKLYKKLKQQNNNSVIKGVELIRQIIKNKSTTINSKIIIEQKQTQIIRIGSRNSVSRQSISRNQVNVQDMDDN